jgi:hypothetical protein
VLVLWHSSLGRPVEGQLNKFELADSVFALTASTMGSDIRYVKALRSARAGAALLASNSEVLVLRSGLAQQGVDGFIPIGVSREMEHYRDYVSEMEAAKYLAAGASKLLAASVPAVMPSTVNFFGID